jgi:hypothetical protein
MSIIMPATDAMAVGDKWFWTVMDSATWMADCYAVDDKDMKLL